MIYPHICKLNADFKKENLFLLCAEMPMCRVVMMLFRVRAYAFASRVFMFVTVHFVMILQ
jgi:hypothetical protein